eukprot:6189961-Pleurochrysis_carterae.AAC.2
MLSAVVPAASAGSSRGVLLCLEVSGVYFSTSCSLGVVVTWPWPQAYSVNVDHLARTEGKSPRTFHVVLDASASLVRKLRSLKKALRRIRVLRVVSDVWCYG